MFVLKFTASSFFGCDFLFEVLIVLGMPPIAAPGETMLSEQAVAKVIARDFVWKCRLSICVAFGNSRFHLAVSLDKGVVKRVNVDGPSVAVVRQFSGTRNVAEVEGRSVVGRHRARIVRPIVVNQPHALNRVVCRMQCPEYADQVGRNVAVTHQFAPVFASFGIEVFYANVAQTAALHGAVLFVTPILHQPENAIGNFCGVKILVGVLRPAAQCCQEAQQHQEPQPRKCRYN